MNIYIYLSRNSMTLQSYVYLMTELRTVTLLIKIYKL
ncbi:unnamed protein product [Nezara viridula]|uniref:Uncharacterized protein n=1 Tax=Nezara viridula TaxID=85310 RepID=A0A9P0H716_NEZVI|nr:unnamed protein product [Nezara viridula]